MPLFQTIRWIILAALFIVMYYAASIFTMKRNIVKVVKAFDENNALNAKGAVKGDALGIRKQDFLERALKKRDNRIHALQFLMNTGLVITTSDGRLYLSKRKMGSYRERGNFITRIIIPPSNK